MADISKINAVLLANIAEIDDVLAANIAKVNGLVFSTAPAFTGLLDTYTGAAAAYSTRRLYGQYTGAALRVREDSGDTETDIGFDSNGDLDTAAIATHCGTANGYVTKWYGQESSGGTGSGLDAAQATSGSQPQIYDGSAVITENGKPTLDFNGGKHISPSSSLSVALDATEFGVYKLGTVKPKYVTNGNKAHIWGYSGNKLEVYQNPRFDLSASPPSSLLVASFNLTSTTYAGFVNGTAGGSGTGTGQTYGSFIGLGRSGAGFSGTFSEFAIWQNQTSNRSGIEGNVNAHFKIGNFGTPTSGLLYDYSGAAAAYSVRQLSNTSALAMRIREDGTDTETDIGFDANGGLDTAAIASHCGANNGYVVTWYDQSGEQNDATQATTGSQPQIYNGTAVITENGKPALDFDGSADYLVSGSFVPLIRSASQVFLKSASTTSSTIWRHNQGNIQYIRQRNTTSFDVRFIGDDTTGLLNTQTLAICHTSSDPSVGGTAYTYLNGTESSSSEGSFSVTTSGTVGIGAAPNGTELWLGTIQEVILWTTHRQSDNSGIQTNVNTYFSVYS